MTRLHWMIPDEDDATWTQPQVLDLANFAKYIITAINQSDFRSNFAVAFSILACLISLLGYLR